MVHIRCDHPRAVSALLGTGKKIQTGPAPEYVYTGGRGGRSAKGEELEGGRTRIRIYSMPSASRMLWRYMRWGASPAEGWAFGTFVCENLMRYSGYAWASWYVT